MFGSVGPAVDPEGLRLRRVVRDWTQSEVCALLRKHGSGATASDVCNWENGRGYPSRTQVAALAQAFGVRIETLATRPRVVDGP
jgi:transcriptional regulator with XRE-family HTH domain